MYLLLLLLLLPHAHPSPLLLRCCTGLASPLASVRPLSSPFGLSGLSISYYHLLSNRLDLHCVHPSNASLPHIQVFPQWDAIIAQLTRCGQPDGSVRAAPNCTCDLGIGGWYETVDRVGVQFLAEFSEGDVRVVIKKRDAHSTLGSVFFLRVFEWKVWVALLALLAAAVAVKLADVGQGGPAKKGSWGLKRVRRRVMKNPAVYKLRKAAQSVVESMLAGAMARRATGREDHFHWGVNLFLALCGLFVLLVYEAVMANAFIQERQSSAFVTVQSLRECEITPGEVCFARGDVVEKIWSAIAAETECLRQGEPRMSGSYEEAIGDLLEDRCTYLITDGGVALQAVQGRYCGRLLVTGEPFFRNALHAVAVQGAPFAERISRETVRLREIGELRTTEEWFEEGRQCVVKESARLTVEKLKSFFWAAFGVVGVLLLEMALDPQNEPKGMGAEEENGKGKEVEE